MLSLIDGATQAIGVALQRSIVRDQLRRAHLRRSLGGDACCDEGYSSSGSDSDGGQGSNVRASSSREPPHPAALVHAIL